MKTWSRMEACWADVPEEVGVVGADAVTSVVVGGGAEGAAVGGSSVGDKVAGDGPEVGSESRVSRGSGVEIDAGASAVVAAEG
jgi:hypothetical protein